MTRGASRAPEGQLGYRFPDTPSGFSRGRSDAQDRSVSTVRRGRSRRFARRDPALVTGLRGHRQPSCSKLVSPAPVTVKGVVDEQEHRVGMHAALGNGWLRQVGHQSASRSPQGRDLSTTTWAGGKGTTTVKVTYTPTTSLGKCPAGTSHILSTGDGHRRFRRRAQGDPEGFEGPARRSASTTKSAATLEPGTKYVF